MPAPVILVFLPLPEKMNVPVPESVVPLPLSQSPNTYRVVAPLNVIGKVRALISMLGRDMFPTFKIVAPEFKPVFSKTAVSCGNGKLLLFAVPPLVRAHDDDVLMVPPATLFQYTVFGVSKVMPELPPQSPSRVPVTFPPDTAAPAMIMFIKSKSAGAETAAHVSVIGLLKKPDCSSPEHNMALVLAVLDAVKSRVPVMV